jgi:hypothetical protein
VKTATWQKLGLGALALVGGVLLLGAKPARGHGTIVGDSIEPYTPSMDEWLLLARACKTEAATLEGQTACAWALIQRFVVFRQEGRWARSFGALVRAFSVGLRNQGRAWSWAWLQDNEPELLFMILSFSAGVPPENTVRGMTNWAACSSETTCRDVERAGNCFCANPPLQGSATVVPAP